MFKNYFITAIRALRRNISYTFLNVFGLVLGIASCLIIFLVVKYELSYDQFNKKANRIYRVTLNAIDFNPNVSMAIVPAMHNDFPELEQVSQVWYQQSGLITAERKKYDENGFAFADQYFPSVFDYDWIEGNPKTALEEPNSVVLTESVSRKYFGSNQAMGRIINLDNRYNLKVTGVVKDVPGNTHLPFTFLISFETVRKEREKMGALSEFYWIGSGSFAYIVIPATMSINQIQKRIPAFIEKNWGKNIAREARLPLQPLTDIHFDQRYLNNSINPTTSRETYWALAAVAVLIIVIACINFINLATAQAIKRAKEVGVRKVLGAHRPQLIWQFLGETSLLVFLSMFLALVVSILFLPQARKWLDIKIDSRQLGEPFVIVLLAALTVIIILLAGLYPAFVQSAFSPVESLKSKSGFSKGRFNLRKGLVVVQFAISQILIIGTLVVASQMDFFQNQDLGFNKEAVISFGIPDEARRDVLSQELIDNPGVKQISFSSGAPVVNSNFTNFSAPELGITQGDVTELKFIDDKYTDLFELKMLSGQKISKVSKNEKDTLYDVVVNETLINKLGIRDPGYAIGKHILVNGNWNSTIMGVVQDFQSESKHKKRRPCVLVYRPDNFYMASVRIQPGKMQYTIDRIDKDWSALFPNDLFRYEFLDDHIANWYRQEQKEYTAFKLFSCVAILIGCLGLYGLIAFAAAQRTKEVGIRKVLGASLPDIVFLFSKEFIQLIVVAFLIAAPVSYYIMHNWLENFAYKISIGGGIFVIAIGVSFMIAAFTIAYQALRAAIANPVNSIRIE